MCRKDDDLLDAGVAAEVWVLNMCRVEHYQFRSVGKVLGMQLRTSGTYKNIMVRMGNIQRKPHI